MTTLRAELVGDTITVHGRTGQAELAVADAPRLIEWLKLVVSDDDEPDPTDDDGDNDPNW